MSVDAESGAVVEDEAQRISGLAALREELQKSGEKLPRDDDQFLLAFLRCAKYKVPKAAARVRNFAAFWYSHRDLIDGLCAEKVRCVCIPPPPRPPPSAPPGHGQRPAARPAARQGPV
jgi:hypothetical protein